MELAASVIAVATLAGTTAKAFVRLRELHKGVPGRLCGLQREVTDIEVVLRNVAAAIKERADLPIPDRGTADIPPLIERAETSLEELKAIVEQVEADIQKNIPIARGYIWRKRQSELQGIQGEIRSVKSSLNTLFGASTNRTMGNVELRLEEITTLTTQSTEKTELMQQGLAHFGTQLSSIGQQLQLQEDYAMRYGIRRRRKAKATPGAVPAVETLSMRASLTSTCRVTCRCSCHKSQKKTSPALANVIIGRLFTGYTGLPIISQKCDTNSCLKAQSPLVSLEYWFPKWAVWTQIIQLQVGISWALGPQYQLKTLRQVPDSAPCVNFALEGNIDALNDLFQRGAASPQDVSSTRGYSLLRWALYGKQYETCRFLVLRGADSEYKPVAAHDDNPKNKACDFLLQGALSKEAAEHLQCLTNMEDFAEEQHFTSMHRIVLGMSGADLATEIREHPDDVNTRDAKGRTPIMWASARGDEQAVHLLLNSGADPNVMDYQYSSPVLYAAAQNRSGCLRRLLQARADPDPPIYKTIQRGNALNVATRLGSDPEVIQMLLDFGADIESVGAEGRTALLHAALSDDAIVAAMLLEYNADINAASKTNQTPLTAAITHNSHDVLRLLLQHWQEFTSCPRLNGPNLLQLAAYYGDLETITILTGVDHLELKYDKDYVAADFETRLQERRDVCPALISGFANLLRVVNMQPLSSELKGSLLDSGLPLVDLEEFVDSEEYF